MNSAKYFVKRIVSVVSALGILLGSIFHSKAVFSNEVGGSVDAIVAVSRANYQTVDNPNAFIGFSISWYNFQKAYWRKDRVRQSLIDYLSHFPGAVYRYSGGDNSYEWYLAIGDRKKRKFQHAKFHIYEKCLFGIGEFEEFVATVGGESIINLNITGTRKRDWSAEEAENVNVSLLEYLHKSRTPYNCNNEYCGKTRLFELGNETDHGENAWRADEYASRVNRIRKSISKKYGEVTLIVHTATSPWNDMLRGESRAKEFNYNLRKLVDQETKNFSLHTYYDGLTVPIIMREINSVVTSMSRIEERIVPASLYITEHARYPEGEKTKNWEKYWPNTGNLRGGISTADFLLSLLPIAGIKAAMWHSLGAEGPWQLFPLDELSDEIYPNVVYWVYRVFQKGLFVKLHKTSIKQNSIPIYKGGYDINAVSMGNELGEISVMFVNRKNSPARISLVMPELVKMKLEAKKYFVSSKNPYDENSFQKKNRVIMRDEQSILEFGSQGQASIVLPANSFTTYLFKVGEGLVK
ncbi:MAG: hypothetical protein OEZ43_20070 [Gammaproteobacteria bacterium]|nr:hypothetical protein [Gammaproteobacteria bacterium]